tara:strand:- start:137 stop:271 length:135 start_codon:yes stop_codon:yes gene_type:complete
MSQIEEMKNGLELERISEEGDELMTTQRLSDPPNQHPDNSRLST